MIHVLVRAAKLPSFARQPPLIMIAPGSKSHSGNQEQRCSQQAMMRCKMRSVTAAMSDLYSSSARSLVHGGTCD